ncbi:hypothetical protein AUJ16_02750 [Candidatus Micrarchaeota archaeon CG1_02_60_51]|nr:MAG: hypothetical protein AUJ16_02750 [Candidatus Micrarchaeota archaeon CG1_02_60_51]PIY91352.1 MAG: hypothetical protein COY71_03605 [Candidatus Micrarchaeota archaeon CG_4_10_14_0_8_um_filter_60_7]
MPERELFLKQREGKFSLKPAPEAPLTNERPAKLLFKSAKTPAYLLRNPGLHALLNPTHEEGAYRKFVRYKLGPNPPASRENIADLFRNNYPQRAAKTYRK